MGPSQGTTVYADGIVCHTTAGHGGFRLSDARNAKVHPMLRTDGGWYEEDAAWAIVALAFPDLFTTYERKCADKTIRDRWPDAWETIFGRPLAPGESYERDAQAFARQHADDRIVTAALRSDQHPGMTEVIAAIGAGVASLRRSAAFWSRATSIRSAASASSSMRRGMPPMRVLPASLLGAGGRRNVQFRATRRAVYQNGIGTAADAAPARSDRPADHATHDHNHSPARSPSLRISSRQGAGARRLPRTLPVQSGSDHRRASAGNRCAVEETRPTGFGNRRAAGASRFRRQSRNSYRSWRQDAMSTIGDLERRAGIGPSPVERTAFWRQFHHLEGEACLNAGGAELKRLIALREARADPRPKTRAVRRTRETLPPLTPEQEAALQSYAARHGRRWKSILNNAWMGGPPHDDGGLLRGLRNSHGPTWLQSYRLPKPAKR
ncbi:hypothetical protein IE4872_PB00142 (plasmid) [Rhizobium gallicum]|uniref:DUF7007 domain-containing protein n=1 Tax=Rhizobium gallicum TaxID=56730 RepID=A0A1L5NQ61_9HYPH|nr:hypothetical protein IE4872_PB00142 [Rhizobium gallicum]